MVTVIRSCAFGAVAVGLAWVATAGAASDEAKAPRQVRVFLLTNADAPVVARTLSDLLREDNKDIRIVADVPTNSVVVEAAQKDIERLMPLLDLLERENRGRPGATSPQPPDNVGISRRSASPADDHNRTPSMLSEEEVTKMSNAEIRKLIVTISGQMQELRTRVNQLESDARVRVAAVPHGGLGREVEDLRARVSKLEADARSRIAPLTRSLRE